MKDTKDEERKIEKKVVNTAFYLMFPAVILAGIAVTFSTSTIVSVIVVALAFYQFLMLRRFIEDYYKK